MRCGTFRLHRKCTWDCVDHGVCNEMVGKQLISYRKYKHKGGSTMSWSRILGTAAGFSAACWLVAGCANMEGNRASEGQVQRAFEVPELIKNMGTYNSSQTDATISMVDDRGTVLFSGKTETVLEGNQLKQNNWSPGARHTIKGRLVLLGYTFDSSATDPLVFRVVRGRGYVYEKGRGSVLTPSGQRVLLQGGSESPNTLADSAKWADSAIVGNDIGAIQRLLTQNPGLVSVTSEDGDSALHTAAWFGRAGIVNALISHGANVKAVNNRGATPLHVAAQLDRKDVAELLLANKADVNAVDSLGRTPLHYAAVGTFSGGSKQAAAHLLSEGATANAKDKKGYTPLHMAAGMGAAVGEMHSAGKGSPEIAALLMSGGADVNAAAENGQTPLAVATANGHTDVADLLRQHGGHE